MEKEQLPDIVTVGKPQGKRVITRPSYGAEASRKKSNYET